MLKQLFLKLLFFFVFFKLLILFEFLLFKQL